VKHVNPRRQIVACWIFQRHVWSVAVRLILVPWREYATYSTTKRTKWHKYAKCLHRILLNTFNLMPFHENLVLIIVGLSLLPFRRFTVQCLNTLHYATLVRNIKKSPQLKSNKRHLPWIPLGQFGSGFQSFPLDVIQVAFRMDDRLPQRSLMLQLVVGQRLLLYWLPHVQQVRGWNS